MKMEENRREFAKKTILAGALCGASSLVKGANERPIFALIGGHNQGRGVALRSIQQGAMIKTFCDLDDEVFAYTAPQLDAAQQRPLRTVKEFRRVLEDKEIDAVIIATPDHWHTHMTLLACQAGKDVYIEKPLSQTIQEGQLIRDAARRYGRVVQVGMQRRSMEHFQSATDYVASGKLGKICLIKAWMCQVRRSIGNPADGSPPPGIDYDAWLGPAPKRPFNVNRFHYNWRFFWDYGNSELGNQGIHMLDVALSGIQKIRGKEKCLPTHVSGHGDIYWLQDAKEVPDTQVINYHFGDFLLVWELRSFAAHHPIEGAAGGTAFYGVDGTLIVDGAGWTVYAPGSQQPVLTAKAAGGSHERNFIECLKSRKRPSGDVEIGRLSTTLCHLGNISHHLQRDLRFNPETETFGADTEANKYLSKRYRAQYELPVPG